MLKYAIQISKICRNVQYMKKNMQQTTEYVYFAYAGKNMHKNSMICKIRKHEIYMHNLQKYALKLGPLHIILICIYIAYFYSCIFKHIMHMFANEMHIRANFDNGCLCIFGFAHLCILFAYLCK